MVNKMLLIINPTRDTSDEKPRFICEKFARRETDKRKKLQPESGQTSLLIND